MKSPFLFINHTHEEHTRAEFVESSARWNDCEWAGCQVLRLLHLSVWKLFGFSNEALEMKSFCCWLFLYNLERMSLIERQIESSHDLVKFSEDEESFWINKSHKPKQMVARMEAASFLKSNLLICFFPNKEFPKVGYDRCRSNLQFIIKHPGAEIVFNAFLLLLSSKSFHIYSIDLMAKRNCKRT